jgi:putative acetyltransferase
VSDSSWSRQFRTAAERQLAKSWRLGINTSAVPPDLHGRPRVFAIHSKLNEFILKGTQDVLGIKIRPVEHHDYLATRMIVDDAFRPEDVVTFLDALRTEGCLLREWLAEDSNGPVAYIAFSRAWVEQPDARRRKVAFLTPLAVRPDRQRIGIGSRLMDHAFKELEAHGETLFLVLGHPEYYPRAGFRSTLAQGIASPWTGNPAFMARGVYVPEGRLVLPLAISDAH